MSARLVALGAITKPHGIRGEVRVHRFNPGSNLLLGLEQVWLRKDGEVSVVDVTSSRPHGELVLLTLAGVKGRDAAEALRGHEVCVPREHLPPLDDSDFYHFDMVGLRAESVAGEHLGIISEVIQYPASDCLVLTCDAGRREIPVTAPYVVELDIEGGRIVLDHLEDFEIWRPKR